METFPIQLAFKEATNGQLYLHIAQHGKELMLTKAQALTLANAIRMKLERD